MAKRPLALTIIALFLAIFSLIGLVGILTMQSNPAMQKAIADSHLSPQFFTIWGVLGTLVNLACAWGIWKGLPWSRVLYVVWGAIGIVVSFYTSPQQAMILLSIVIFVVIAAFLFGNRANEWFSARGFALSREDALTPR